MSSSDSSFWFQSKYPVPNAVSTGKASSTCIHSLLETIQNKSFAESFEKFPNAERIDLAYQVAECGLMLLGTSWLSGVRSTQIKRLKNHLRQQSLFILEISDGNGEGFVIENDLLSAVEPQTFMIGVLLTEIAIATPVTGLEPYTSQDGRQKLALRITRKDDQGNKQHHGMKLGAAVREVNNCMHLSYSDAVDFCLRQSGINRNPAWAQLRGLDDADVPGRNEAYRSLLKDFYEQVFVRIQKLYEIFFIVQSRAKKARIYDYIDPTKDSRPRQPIAPTKPPLPIGNITDTDREEHKWKREDYKEDKKEYDRQIRELNDLLSLIKDLVS
ncbi:Integrase catalytic core [Botryosphaeria dothidea]|uniref:Integrase catalytic core n=1 Tax=Botryosphaeria dothidea TaxID=55169 RepID=A0A8H4IRM1_9PEZI|nr:Integrase catalytic core [Botryosphaeria dothidea]